MNESYKVILSLGAENLGDCPCPICDKPIKGTDDCISITETLSGYLTYVCSSLCSTFYILRGKENK